MKVSTHVQKFLDNAEGDILWSTRMEKGMNPDWRIHLASFGNDLSDCLILDYGEKDGFAVYEWQGT